jgi:serine/threonine-protein kinase RsbW
MPDSVTFQAEMQMLEAMMHWIRERIDEMGFSVSDSRKIQIAMEEALVNVILHAYKEGRGQVELICDRAPSERIAFIIKDMGPSFNPLLQTPKLPPIDTPLEEHEEGGLGILFIREYMDEVHYERHHPYNVLTLIKVI